MLLRASLRRPSNLFFQSLSAFCSTPAPPADPRKLVLYEKEEDAVTDPRAAYAAKIDARKKLLSDVQARDKWKFDTCEEDWYEPYPPNKYLVWRDTWPDERARKKIDFSARVSVLIAAFILICFVDWNPHIGNGHHVFSGLRMWLDTNVWNYLSDEERLLLRQRAAAQADLQCAVSHEREERKQRRIAKTLAHEHEYRLARQRLQTASDPSGPSPSPPPGSPAAPPQ
eukprot:gnl/Spiro4/17506_TR9321_c1_g1_i1.p1 gnl/Spiro4/17506_TR9321_c1_g1~~gnl/Spiro4/17506_TR9321_c1_g1_i1.p1  ORF type:complete len:227 (-),score=78.33 gnl/Spiro4/17506_TR9321_c1_g1_i1:139-819(-)